MPNESDCEPFRLTSPPQPKRREKFSSEPARQLVLLTGLQCLPGQESLFDSDGPKEIEDDTNRSAS